MHIESLHSASDKVFVNIANFQLNFSSIWALFTCIWIRTFSAVVCCQSRQGHNWNRDYADYFFSDVAELFLPRPESGRLIHQFCRKTLIAAILTFQHKHKQPFCLLVHFEEWRYTFESMLMTRLPDWSLEPHCERCNHHRKGPQRMCRYETWSFLSYCSSESIS